MSTCEKMYQETLAMIMNMNMSDVNDFFNRMIVQEAMTKIDIGRYGLLILEDIMGECLRLIKEKLGEQGFEKDILRNLLIDYKSYVVKNGKPVHCAFFGLKSVESEYLKVLHKAEEIWNERLLGNNP